MFSAEKIGQTDAEGKQYQCLTWGEIERAKLNPLTQLIDEKIDSYDFD